MAFEIRFKRLFTVNIWHHFYLNKGEAVFSGIAEEEQAELLSVYDIQKDLEVRPTKQTQKVMAGMDILFRQNSTGFFGGMKVQPADSAPFYPFKPVSAPFKLAFEVRVINPLFFGYTNLPLVRDRSSLFYFSNLAGNAGATFPSLSRPIPAYSAGTDYPAGTLLQNAAGTTVYEAAYTTNSALNSAAWSALPEALPYISTADKVRALPPVFRYKPETAGLTALQLSVTDPRTGAVVHQETFTEEQAGSEAVVELPSLAGGRYTFSYTGSSGYSDNHEAYLLENALQAAPFGVVELFFDPATVAGSYRMFDESDNQALLFPEFEIRLPNRASYWRYIFGSDQSVSDADLGDFVREGAASEVRRFVTNAPRHLTKAYGEIRKFNTSELLPNPEAAGIKPQPDPLDATRQKVYSEVYTLS